MSVVVWRIAADSPDYEAHDLSGKGAQTTGGRWNRKGTPMVYASDSRALACLETVMHLGADLPLNRYLVEIRIPDALWKRRVVFEPKNHIGWDAEPHGEVSIDWGSAWAHGGSTLLGQVPSVIVPEEPNVLINARHRDARKLKAIKVRRWTYDTRLR